MDGETSSISRFYDGRSILITGATGFMGKVLVEKLLRSCPGIESIYILMRPKRGRAIEERLQQMLSYELFQVLKETKKEVLEKLVPIRGDMDEEGLGLSEEDRQLLREKVSVVFHNAASIRLNQDMGSAFKLIARGTKDLLELSKSMKNLQVFIYVSTAYSNCENRVVEERRYDTTYTYDNIMEALKLMNGDCLKEVQPLLLEKKENAYLFAKSYAENIVEEYSDSIPVAIFRPSVVVASYKEPIAGWIDNLTGPTGLIVGCWMGLIFTIHGDLRMRADIVPVDMAINCLIAVSWKTYVDREKSRSCVYYNYSSGDVNTLTWKMLSSLAYNYGMPNPSKNAIWLPAEPLFTSNPYVYWPRVFLFQILPAYIIDFLSYVLGKERRMVKIQQKIGEAMNLFTFFTTTDLVFKNKNIFTLKDSMNFKDQELFDYDVRQLDWKSYFDVYMWGMQKHLMKETEEDIVAARERQKGLFWLDRGTKLLFGGLSLCFVYKIFMCILSLV